MSVHPTVAFILVFFLVARPAVGQPASATQRDEEAPEVTEYVARAFTTEDGLPQNVVRAVEVGVDGGLWVGTYDGLAYYDGHSFTRFNAAEIEGLVSNRVIALEQQPDGTLWIGTETGLSVLQGNTFRTIPTLNNASRIESGPGGTVWVVGEDENQNKQFYRATAEGVRSLPMPDSLPNARVGHIAPAGPDSVWASLSSGDLFLWEGTVPTRPARINRKVENPGGYIEVGPNGRLWTVSGSEVISVRDQSIRRWPLDVTAPQDIEVGPDGTPWITTLHAGLLHVVDGRLRRVRAGGLLSGTLFGLARDESGQWWVGTQGNGLVRLRPRLFSAVDTGISGQPAARGIYASDDGTVWNAFQGPVLLEIAGDRRAHWTEADGLPPRITWTVGQGRTGPLAVGTLSGLAWLKNGRFELAPQLAGTKVTALHRASTGALWIGTGYRGSDENEGLYQFRNGELRRILPPDLVPARVNALHRDGSGTVWIGTASEGLARLEDDSLMTGRSLVWYDTDDGLPYISVRDVYETNEGTIWVGTYGGGMARFEGDSTDGSTFTAVTPDDGLPSGTINAIHEAPDGIFWLTSNEGVFRIPREQLAAVADGRQDRVYPRVFGSEDGMPDRECNGPFEPSIAEGPQGRLWIPTMKGPTVVDPGRDDFYAPDSLPVRVTEVRADGAAVPLDSLRLGPSTYRVAIDFTAVSLRYGEDLRFRYRLDDGEWRPVQRRTAEYTGLAPGTHRFEVQATLQGRTWHALNEPLAVTVQPHFYQTWWFRFSIGCWLLILGYGAYRYRTYQLRKRKQVLEETVADRTRELRERKDRLADQIDTLKGAMARVETGDLDVSVDAQREDELGELAHSFNHMVEDLRERSLLQQHVGEHTLEMVRSTDDRSAGRPGEGRIREVAILFTDIRGSTEKIGRTDPESFVEQLNRTFDRQAEATARFGGSIDKFVGDAMIALFMEEKPLERALQCSVAIQCDFQQDPVTSSFFEGLGIGVNYGPVLMGNIGGEERLDYSVIGPEVNLGARLCEAAGPGEVLVREELVERHGLTEAVRTESVEERSFKGFEQRFRVAEVVYECEER